MHVLAFLLGERKNDIILGQLHQTTVGKSLMDISPQNSYVNVNGRSNDTTIEGNKRQNDKAIDQSSNHFNSSKPYLTSTPIVTEQSSSQQRVPNSSVISSLSSIKTFPAFSPSDLYGSALRLLSVLYIYIYIYNKRTHFIYKYFLIPGASNLYIYINKFI